eukprot:6455668-Amphidinium_carterae.1
MAAAEVVDSCSSHDDQWEVYICSSKHLDASRPSKPTKYRVAQCHRLNLRPGPHHVLCVFDRVATSPGVSITFRAEHSWRGSEAAS